jgi:hypothetical protein
LFASFQKYIVDAKYFSGQEIDFLYYFKAIKPDQDEVPGLGGMDSIAYDG